MVGTNLLAVASTSPSILIQNTDTNGNGLYGIVLTAGSTPSAKAGYAIGCILIDGITGIPWVNTGTVASCSFVKVSST
jgi:hypothetical protein